jgi:hypothetical protein
MDQDARPKIPNPFTIEYFITEEGFCVYGRSEFPRLVAKFCLYRLMVSRHFL